MNFVEIVVYILLILTIVSLIIYCILFHYTEYNPRLNYYNIKIKLQTDLDLENIIINQIQLIKRKLDIFSINTKTLSHFDFILKDINDKYYSCCKYKFSNTLYIVIKTIKINELKNNYYTTAFNADENNRSYVHKIKKTKYNIKPCALNIIYNTFERILNYGYHGLKFNCHHQSKLLIDVLSNKKHFTLKPYEILDSFYKIIYEYFHSLLK